MARADQIKALFRAYAGNEDAQFISVALQVAADEARRGHSKLAAELRELIEKARAPAAPRARARGAAGARAFSMSSRSSAASFE